MPLPTPIRDWFANAGQDLYNHIKAALQDHTPPVPATLPLPTGAAKETKQDTEIARLDSIIAKIIAAPATEAKQTTLEAAVNAPARGTVLTPVPAADWTGAPWDGVAPKKLTVRTGAGPVWIVQAYLQGGGGGGGCATCALHFGPVGFTLTTETRLVQLAIPIGDSAVVTPLGGRVLVRADANGQIDYYVVPNAGTTAKKLEVEVVAA